MLAKPVVRFWKALDGGSWLCDLLLRRAGCLGPPQGFPEGRSVSPRVGASLCRETGAMEVGGGTHFHDPTQMVKGSNDPSMESSTLPLTCVPTPGQACVAVRCTGSFVTLSPAMTWSVTFTETRHM